MKPVRRAELRAAIIQALGSTAGEKAGEPASPVSKVATRMAPEAPRSRILLAEDNIVNQRVAARLLEKGGHSVVIVGNGKEAIAALHREAFDMILMDVQMPEMDGFEATKAIRNSAGGKHIPIIAMTAHAMTGDRERCLEAGMDAYLSKPIRATDLLNLIEQTSRQRVESAPRTESH